MKPAPRLALAIAAGVAVAVAAMGGYVAAVWRTFDPAQRAALAPLLEAYRDNAMLLLAMLGLGIGLALAPLYRAYVLAPLRLAQATRLIAGGNPGHRIVAEGGREVRELADAINLLAGRYEEALREAQRRIDAARHATEHDKNRLAALMDELAHAVVVCNMEGTVLLYNGAARDLFTRHDGAPGTTLLGLGRSVFALIDRTLLAHSLGRLSEQLGRGAARPVVHFVSTTPAGELLRTQMAPIRNAGGGLDGYILTFSDALGELAFAERGEGLLQTLAETGRAALGNVRAAAEAMAQADTAHGERRAGFLRVIREETDALAKRLDGAAREYGAQLRAQWPLEGLSCADFVALARQHVEHTLRLPVRLEHAVPDAWVRVDSYLMLQLCASLARHLQGAHGAREVFLRAWVAAPHVQIDIGARALVLDAVPTAAWETLAVSGEAAAARHTVADVMGHHGGLAWQQADAAAGELYYRLLLPLAERERETPRLERAHESRPEFYDFDLFHQAGQTAALETRRLSELSYTVFDTETTGLEPSRGDEIIAIGAVRIVNGRLLPHEAFEQLVDPRRPLSPGSARVTGIDAQTLRGQPPIEDVLPLFHGYCADTVLVAHNAAFDMRFLQLKEQASGVRFTQPVLDTLLLSAVLHPALESHRLEAIAERHGVSIMGRHTALGDAMVTAEIFMRMIPQLAERGILTLRDAQHAAQRTYYARVRY